MVRSRETIARSRQRIDGSKLRLTPRDAWFVAGSELSDIQRGALLELRQAQAEQREIDPETGLTTSERSRDRAA
jgi:hypothetical protein